MGKLYSFKVLDTINGEEMIFNPRGLKKSIEKKATEEGKEKGKRVTKEAVILELADAVMKSPESIKNYCKGYNGPSDLGVVKDMATYLAVEYIELLTKKVVNCPDFGPVADNAKSIVMQMYDMIIDYVYEYIGSSSTCLAAEKMEEKNPYIEPQKVYYELELYHFLDKAALKLSADDYAKLHRIITECGLFEGQYGVFAKRWVDVNPKMREIEELYDYDYISELNDKYYDTLMEETRREVGISETSPFGYDIDWRDYESYQIVARETARTITMIFRQDFPEYFG